MQKSTQKQFNKGEDKLPTVDKILIAVMCGTRDKNIPFSDLQKLLAVLGFQCRIKEDHYIYYKNGGLKLNKYKQVIYWSEEEHKFIVEVPELPGCMADGMTEEEALKNTEQIVSEWVETARILGRKVPQPERKVVYM